MSDENRTQPEIENPIALAATARVETKDSNTDPGPACCTSPPSTDPPPPKG